MLIYNISIFKTKLGYFELKSIDNKIMSFYPSKKRKIEFNNCYLHKKFYVQINKYFNNEKTFLRFNTKMQGTSFQKKVWNKISKIKFGHTKSYFQIAKELNTSPRAVGNACGRNKCLFIVPCHRVICLDGNLGGYILGKKIKRHLIKLEKYGK